MKLDSCLYKALLVEAERSPRKRMHRDLRDTILDCSQRMLNAILPESKIPIHRHNNSSETVIVVRGEIVEILYDGKGIEMERIKINAGEGYQVPQGQFHTAVAVVPSVIVEFKNGIYDPVTTEDFLTNNDI